MRVVVAMSGGVDSSVAACLLKREGYDVIGLFMRTGAHTDADEVPVHKKGCCSAQDAGDARRVADQLDIPFYAIDFAKEFDRIIDYFADEYLAGRTPNPCVVCNNWLKFGKLLSYARQLEADYVATGHYAQMIQCDGIPELHCGADPAKDQSYVLFGLGRTILPRILFPIGKYLKCEIRDFARKAGLPVSEKPDSVEICFVPNGDHGSLIRQRRPHEVRTGRIRDKDGTFLAAHDGVENFTVGQRKGLGFAAGKRRYVLQIVAETNDIVVGDREQLMGHSLQSTGVNWLTPQAPKEPVSCSAKIRYRHAGARAVVIPQEGSRAQVDFLEPQCAIAPGQAVVFYQGTRVLGGGWIERAT